MTELAEVFRRYGSQYLTKYGDKIIPRHLQAMRDIQRCRTEELGGHVYHCPKCDEDHYLYHSCRNRHCPKCQHDRGQEWLEKQKELLLPAPYFLLTFTLPASLRRIVRSNQSIFYNLFFRISAAATQKLVCDPRFVGGKIGMVGVLHTWGRNLVYHPHIHYLVPGGGLTPDGRNWLPGRNSFLLPVKALSRIFRAKFREALQKTDFFNDIPKDVWGQEWVVHCKPVGDGQNALKYLSAYVFRVAISNSRILKTTDGKVTFRFKDTQTGKTRFCTLAAGEFIRRFLQHVLPRGFVKVRYYGLFSHSYRSKLIELQKQLVFAFPEIFREGMATEENPSSVSSKQVLCLVCGRAMLRIDSIPRQRGHPP